MKGLAALLVLAAATVSPDIRYFRYERPVENAPQQPGPTCIPLDAALYAHSAPALADLRLYRDRRETPYILQMSSPPPTVPEQAIPVLNLGSQGGRTVFDALMPAGSSQPAGGSVPAGTYNDLTLDVTGHDFIATVAVAGSQHKTGTATRIGDYTIFDLTRQRLGRSTVLHLPNADFRYLHFRITGPLRPENITRLGLRQAQASEPDYTVVDESRQVRLRNHSSIVEFTVPAHIPVDRVVVVAGPTPANFSRDATVQVRPMNPEPSEPMTSNGNLLRVHNVEDNHHINQEHLELDVPRQPNDSPANWTITIDNGDDAPLVPSSVRLEMVKRNLCFEASSGAYTLYYGDARLNPPRYDLGQFLVVHSQQAAQASAGPEQ